MTTARRILALAAILALSATSAGAADGDCRLIQGATTEDAADDVQVCRQDTWIHQAETKAGNAAAFGTPASSAYPSWSTTPPAASVQTGAGGGYVGAAAFSQNVSRFDPRGAVTFRGTFTGNLDNLGATLYLFSPVRQLAPTQAVALRLTVDGEVLYLTGGEADRTPLQPAGDAVLRTDFAFVDVHARMEALGLDTGDDAVHDVELAISQWFTVNDNAVYVYDTTEVPAGIVFNLEPAGLKAFSARIDVG